MKYLGDKPRGFPVLTARPKAGRAAAGEFNSPQPPRDGYILYIGKRASDKFSNPLSEAGAVLAQPETQVIIPSDDEPANLPLLVDPTPSGGTPRL